MRAIFYLYHFLVSNRKFISVYDANNGALLFTTPLTREDDTLNFSIATNADMSKFVITAANPEREGNYGVAYFYKYAGVKEIDTSTEATTVTTDSEECFRIEVKTDVDIDVSLDSYGNVIGLFGHDGTVDEMAYTASQAKGKTFDEALFLILEWRGKKGKLRSIDTVEIKVLKADDIEVQRLDAILFNAEYTCKDVGEAFDAAYDVNIDKSDYEVVE